MDADEPPAATIDDNDRHSDGLAHTLDAALEADHLRILSRSPHPYHHNNADLPHPAHRIASLSPTRDPHHPPLLLPQKASPPAAFGKDSTPASDSGTEADDEHFLKGLPAPRSKPRKGLRGMNEVLSGVSTPLLSPVHNLSDRDGPLSLAPLEPGQAGKRQRRAAGSMPAQDSCGDSESVACSLSVFDDDDDEDDDDAKFRRKNGNSSRYCDAPGALDSIGEETGSRRRQSSLLPKRKLSQKSSHTRSHKHDAALLDIRDKDRRQGKGSAERSRRRREIARRSAELLLLVSLAALLFSNPQVRPLVFHWRFELQAVTAITLGLLVLYPVRLVIWACRSIHTNPSGSGKRSALHQRIGVPASFDPAPIFYPLAIPVLVSFLLATPTLPAAPLLNLILSICALPKQLIPFSVNEQLYDPIQWALSCIPMFVATQLLPSSFKEQALSSSVPAAASTLTSSPPPPFGSLSPDVAVLLYPLHQTLCWLLYDLTTTSLLRAELQLLSAALINLLVLAMSPQAVILQALLWGGGLSMLVSGSSVVRWGIMLARIPRWRFRREQDVAPDRSFVSSIFSRVWFEIKSLRRARLDMMYGPFSGAGLRGGDAAAIRHSHSGDSSADACELNVASVRARLGSQSGPDEKLAAMPALAQRWPDQTAHITVTQDEVNSTPENAIGNAVENPVENPVEHAIGNTNGVHELAPRFAAEDPAASVAPAWMAMERAKTSAPTTTPSGRRKRTTSMSARAFFSLTYVQAVRRKWMYAGFLYACIAFTILVILRAYIGAYALRGSEPFGWALGYLFGGFDGFRLEVVKANLENWVCLPPRALTASDSLLSDLASAASSCVHCRLGWVEHVRQTWLGAATTRLLLFAYWGLVIVFGLAVVFTLSPVYEVDTRRKVFHFVMVAVLLPATFIDPAFAGLALALVLSVFLLLDLLRASQLPPLSRPIATFLTPYVDGRDLRGPVVISHIFLLIGCAIPLWLSLASLPRSLSADCSTGWEVPTRDVSMVSGVICVGLGDAAASLIGRRWGRRKWVWGGGKSLEGSVAFATAVFIGLMAASLWLRVGGWPVTGEELLLASAPGTGSIDRTVAWIGGRAAQAVAPRAGVCAAVASLTEAVLTGGNDNVVVPVILWTCVKSFGL
ncbi:dolichol kinase [Ophiostoma piceae UAMH 11346]|uniref:dolichol kinase n=1 Tax=Ophiostoma piceae (strain UAMH 11346) TaxID=1262450 RepID=S3CBW3_OPHP1|nr:dolichol kinase [Ophiostoma piceae UAMH 11346]